MVRRTLMQGDQELVDFDVDPVTGKAHIVNVLNSSLEANRSCYGEANVEKWD